MKVFIIITYLTLPGIGDIPGPTVWNVTGHKYGFESQDDCERLRREVYADKPYHSECYPFIIVPSRTGYHSR